MNNKRSNLKWPLRFLVVLLLCVAYNGKAQVPQEIAEQPIFSTKGIYTDAMPRSEIVLPDIDIAALMAEDERRPKDMPYRFGAAVDQDYNLDNSGEWFDTDEGRIWKLVVRSKQAYSLNFVFSKFKLPDGAALYIYSEDHTALYGPLTSRNNNEDGTFATDLVRGDAVVFEYFVPRDVDYRGDIVLSRIVHAYRDMFNKSGYGTSGSCNIDIKCSTGNNWCVESRAVAMILTGGGVEMCSGAMINNAQQNLVPYFLTANHCLSPLGTISTTVYRFHYWNPSCGASTYSGTYWSVNGATLRANNAASDFALLEINYNPNDNYSRHMAVQYAGWSRSSTAATSATAIHHPAGDVMKISVAGGAVSRSSAYGSPNHWQANWTAGVTEGGSSGSPLFDQNHRVIGQLHGGPSSCSSSSLWDYYGSFDFSWTGGGSNSTRLSNWLDPGSTGAMVTNARSPMIVFHNKTISGASPMRTATQNMEIAGEVNSPGYFPPSTPPWIFPNMPRAGLPFVVQSGANITYKAGESIDILPGVTVQAGSVFLAQIAPVICSDGLDYLYKTGGTKEEEERPIVKEDNKTIPTTEAARQGFTVYPNPATSVITLQVTDKSLFNKPFVVMDMLGNAVYKGRTANVQQRIDISTLSSGIYYITINGNTAKFTKK